MKSLSPPAVPLQVRWLLIAAGLITLCLFSFNVYSRAFLGDDAFIAFRYARNLVDGQGLTWNPGERVEGYTSLLWVLTLAAGMFAGVPPESLTMTLGVASGVAILALVYLQGARSAGLGDPFSWIAPLTLAVSRSFTAWSTGGLETQFFALLVFGGYVLFLREQAHVESRPFGSSALLGLATLTRPEGLLFAAPVAFVLAVGVVRGRRPVRTLAEWSLVYSVPLAGQLIFRLIYYGEWLPNTFYAKVSGVWLSQGWTYLSLAHEDYRLFWFLPLAVVSIAARRDTERFLFGGACVLYATYLLCIGGDRFELRFLVHALPMLYLLVADGLRVIAGDRSTSSRWRSPRWAIAVSGGVMLVAMTHIGSDRPEARRYRRGVTSIEGIGSYARGRLRQGQFLRSQIDAGKLPFDLVLAVSGAGALPYVTGLTTVDYHGLNDARVARIRTRTHAEIGHEKLAPPAYLAERGVDVFDVLNRLVFPDEPRIVEEAFSDATRRLREIDPDSRYLRAERLRTGGKVLVFGTTLSSTQFAQRFQPPPAVQSASPAPEIRLEVVASKLARPLFVTHAGDGSRRLFVVEQGGLIRILAGGRLLREPFLDARSLLDESGGERGLLGLAFAPDYARSRRFYIAHTAPGPSVRVTRLRVSVDPNRADPASARVALELPDPASNHNGGMIAFGPDGYLWYGTGDGGRAGDPWDNARNPGSLLGKMLRLDVREEPYGIPPENPFAHSGGGRPEIWALGLRNPWRFSFDRGTGELWIADVGQNAWEEINVEDPRRGGGRHYGWRTMEGPECYSPRRDCNREGLTPPLHAYGHDWGCSVTGGYVYRGNAIPALVGTYLFSDYCSGTLWGLRRTGAGAAEVSVLLRTGLAMSSFGEDADGEIYLCDHRRGRVLRLEASAGREAGDEG